MRIDRLLCELNIGSRSQVKELLKKGLVSADGQIIKKADTQVDENCVTLTVKGKNYNYRPFVYYMLNKPAGVITATRDTHDRTVMDLLKEEYQLSHDGEAYGLPLKDMFPVGRLDKDTVGLLLITNDGELSHNLLAPGKHVDKTYLVHLNDSLSEEMAEQLEQGVDIGEEKMTQPAVVEIDKSDASFCRITITEGKFHQVKRMFEAIGRKVIYLKRLSMGTLVLDETLPEGKIRELTKEEVDELRKGCRP